MGIQSEHLGYLVPFRWRLKGGRRVMDGMNPSRRGEGQSGSTEN